MTTLGALVNKAKAMEEVEDKMKAKDESQKGSLGMRSFGSYKGMKFEMGSGSGFNKNWMYKKAPTQGQGSN